MEKLDVRAEIEGSRAEKFQELRDHLEAKQGKYSKAETMRMAVDLAHQKLQDLRKEKTQTMKNFEEVENKLKRITDV